MKMGKLTIVGMGPGGKNHLTIAAIEALTKGGKVYLRTAEHPTVSYLTTMGMVYESFDDCYEQAATFEETYEKIVTALSEKLKTESVTYAVPGNAHVAEKTVSMLITYCRQQSIPYEVIHGTSFLDAMITALELDPVKGLQIQDALTFAPETLYIGQDLIVLQIFDQKVASEVKIKLADYYDDEHEIAVVCAAGVPGEERIERLPLYAMDRDASLFTHLTSLYIPGVSGEVNHMARLIRIMRELRSETGCPWDREQTHETLTKYLIEEAYEVKHAVEHEDDQAVVDELGDVLLQVVFHTTIAEEEGFYRFEDVIKAVCDKMIRRHPHVFGNETAETSDAVLVNWQAIKNKEKKATTQTHAMSNVSFSMPALMRSQKIQKLASAVGFDWQDAMKAFEKVKEEVDELENAISEGDHRHQVEEIGDLMMIIANVGRLLKIDTELALNEANEKFIRRFNFVEDAMKVENQPLSYENLELMERFWQEAKKWENS
jgi:tetrapyrrole methylase family protein/MazG family protein